jgi:NAD(P)-dependent dehydrogenase (short-subunit alcohol dehydrogenase family)
MKLSEKTAVIVGGTGDIGHATARLFVEAGASVVVTGRDRTRAEAKAAALGPLARGAAVDPADEGQLRQFFAATGPFDYLLVTIGTQALTKPFAQLTDDDLRKGMSEKLLHYSRVLRAALGRVRESVTWLTGAAARTAVPGLGNYAAANGALHAVMGPLAVELLPVRINCVASGLVRTDFWNKLGMSFEDQSAMYSGAEASIPLRHVAAPDEIAHALFFAATNTYTTGTVLDTNGGLHLGRVDAPGERAPFGSVSEGTKEAGRLTA